MTLCRENMYHQIKGFSGSPFFYLGHVLCVWNKGLPIAQNILYTQSSEKGCIPKDELYSNTILII